MTRDKALDYAVQIISALVSNDHRFALNRETFDDIIERIIVLADKLENVS